MEILIGIAAIGIILVTLPALLQAGGILIVISIILIGILIFSGLLGTFWGEIKILFAAVEKLFAAVMGILIIAGILAFVRGIIRAFLPAPDNRGSSNSRPSALEQEQNPDVSDILTPRDHPVVLKLNVAGSERIPHWVFVRRILKEGISEENFDDELWLSQENVNLAYIDERNVDAMTIRETMEYNKTQKKMRSLKLHKQAIERSLTIWNELLLKIEAESGDKLREMIKKGDVPPVRIYFKTEFDDGKSTKALNALHLAIEGHAGSFFDLLWTYCPRVHDFNRKWKEEGLAARSSLYGNDLTLVFSETSSDT